MSQPRLVAVDIGNSATKIGWFGPRAPGLPTPQAVHAFATGTAPPAELAANLPPEPCQWHVSSVHREGTRILQDWIRVQRPGDRVQVLTHRDMAIRSAVEFPE